MLDVHAPEHPIGGLRDFFLHLFTITCGLLIALALENAAEALHHRHERREADALLREELRENQDAMVKALPGLRQEIHSMVAAVAFLQARSEGKPQAAMPDLSFSFTEYEIQDVAWRTAATTGTLAYMDYTDVEKFAAAYREQELLQTQEQQALSDFLQLSTFRDAFRDTLKTVQDIKPEQAAVVLPQARKALGDLYGIYSVGSGTLAAYKDVLK